ncbi:alpha/beta-hydrolase, partial [Polychaeton citri CBS 116435]
QRDMIEEEVVSRLRAPRLNCKVRDALSGRVISFSEVGDPEGNAILMCTGLGLTRYVSELFHELAIALHIRIITIERPGIGASEAHSPYDATGPLAWPNDVRTVCHHIGVRKFSILAHSAGAAYGMAVALTLPQMVRGKVHLMAPWIPPSQLEGLNAEAVGSRVGRSQRILRKLPTPVIRMANLPMVNAAAASMKPLKPSKTSRRQKRAYDDVSNSPQSQSSRSRHPGIRHSMILMDHYLPNNCPYDLTTGHPLISGNRADPVARAAWSRRMAQRTWELAITDGNPAVDLLVCIERDRKVGFSFFDVPLDIVITHGSEDTRIPLEHVRWLAENLNRRNRCELRVLDGQGHSLMADSAIVSSVLAEIAAAWDR